ncbi:MAG: YceI family protein [Oligoflexia bacterium]|nr:YceI family protein [Oligoflexia bacterium]
MIERILAFLAVIALSGSAEAADAAKARGWTVSLDQGESSIEFVAVGKPKAIKILGKGSAAKGQLHWDQGKGSGKISFALDSLDTGIRLRDEHMKKRYLETARYPEALLQIASVGIPPARANGSFSVEKVPFTGQLTLHGVTRPVQGRASLVRDGNDLQIDSEFEIKITDFRIEVPSYMGITVANEVQVQVRSKAPITQRH